MDIEHDDIARPRLEIGRRMGGKADLGILAQSDIGDRPHPLDAVLDQTGAGGEFDLLLAHARMRRSKASGRRLLGDRLCAVTSPGGGVSETSGPGL